MLTERTVYWPQEGKGADVLALRREACAIRRSIGLPMGRILRRRRRRRGDGAMGVPVSRARPSARPISQRVMRAPSSRMCASAWARSSATSAAASWSTTRRRSALSPRAPSTVIRWCRGRSPSQSAGLDLAGFLFLPPGEGPFPAMVINHGSSIQQGSDEPCRPGIAALLNSWGIACLMPNRRGYGNSPGVPWREEVSAPFGTPEYDKALATRLDGESDDVVAAGRISCAACRKSTESMSASWARRSAAW